MFTKLIFYYLIYTFVFIFLDSITFNTMHPTFINIFITQIISIHFINLWDLFFNEIYKFIFMFFFIIKNIYLINPLI